MEETKVLDSEEAKRTESLYPTTERIMDPVSYTCAWLGGNISVGAFMVGASLVPPAGHLNLLQAIIALVIGFSVTAIFLTINGVPGLKYGIPFVMQARTCFGSIGMKLPAVFRAAPALMWFGIQSWVGASALNTVVERLWGYDNLIVVFILFQVAQALFALTGWQGMKWLENIGVVVMLFALVYMFYTIVTEFGAKISETVLSSQGTWGMPFYAAITMALGFSTTLITNISDYMREVPKTTSPRTTVWLHWIGFVPSNIVLCLIGLLCASIMDEWDPVKLFTQMLPSSPVLIITLIFIALAQITTNMFNNLVPASYVLMDFFKSLKYKTASIICVGLSFLTFPWMISTTSLFKYFILIYSAFLGPIFSVMVVDYYILRKQTYDIDLLYKKDGPYFGINWQGIIAICVGAVSGLWFTDISWFVTLIPSGLTYYLLMKYKPISPSFLEGTIFKK